MPKGGASKPQGKQRAALASAGEVLIRRALGAAEVIARVPCGRALQQAAMEWTFVLRNRRRWTLDPDTVQAQSQRVTRTLRDIGIDRAALEVIAQAGVVEIAGTFVKDEDAWEARVFPWEHALSSATRPFRDGAGLTIVRSLAPAVTPAAVRWPAKVLYVESAPCGLRSDFSFEAEERLIRLAFARSSEVRGPIQVEVLRDPTLSALADTAAALAPDVVHLAGFDAHQARRLLDESLLPPPDRSQRFLDGYLLRSPAGKGELVGAEPLARAITAGSVKPALVSFNIYNSGARLAAHCVALGAAAAIGYQDDFNDRLAELLYQRLYWAWSQEGEDLFSAFAYAWGEVRRRSDRLTGTGVVLWGAHSWARGVSPDARQREFTSKAEEERDRLLPTPDPAAVPQMTADIVPFKELNYSILHNRGQQVFEKFIIAKPSGRVRDVTVRASVGLGADGGEFEMTAALQDAEWSVEQVNLGERVCVPLVSRLLRSLREGVRTTITARVTWGPHVIYHQTHPVALLAIDEWKDDDANRMWLPSFMQPGDPGVLRVIDAAQKYLAALNDDFVSAGFDGYQQEDPGAVDVQARAIWTALVQDFALSYINPPPTYTGASQRLRTPATVLDGRRGTCIDLALLYGACLEFVNIHPIMILLAGHAFPAYWRSEAAHERFVEVGAEYARSAAEASSTSARGQSEPGAAGDAYPWYERAQAYPWLMDRVRAGDIVPLETVFLTQKASFEEAIAEGRANLNSPEEFDSILDVRLARDRNATPLPMQAEVSR